MIIGAMLVRNEAGRYLERVLEQIRSVCDEIVVLDDASTDDTVEICRRYGAYIEATEMSYFGENELYLRKRLWFKAQAWAETGDWILCLDADETIPNIDRLPEIVKEAAVRGADSIGFRLHDMWGETHYRDDAQWSAHRRLWPMCVKVDRDKNYRWNEQPLHCGRFPVNAAERIYDPRMDLQHWGWSREEDRRRKYDFYKRIDTNGHGNAVQYESILDPTPKLRKFGAKQVLIGAPVRQDETIFRLYLNSLRALNTTGLEVDWFFILHNSPHLADYLKPHQYRLQSSDGSYVRDDTTHHWTGGNLRQVAEMKNELLRMAQDGGYDFFFLVDSDLLLHQDTLQQLVKADKQIVSNVFWTRWGPDTPEMPNAWDFDRYLFQAGSLEAWQKPGLHQVGMSGACILISREVIDAGVNYSAIYNVSHSIWEDRAFCIRAACAGFPIYMDTTYPARHLYRESDVQEVLRNAR
jgi:glycosyltransferase involved in cell wall biosynthesis